MPNSHGSFIWYELMTPDPDAAARFYGDVVGWTIGGPTGEPMDYRMIQRSDSGHAGGVLPITPDMQAGGARAAWLGYIGSDDVDASVAAATAAGGQVHMAPFDIAQGRVAMIADPQGAVLYVMTPTPPADTPDAVSDVFSVDRAQHVRWNELSSRDADGAIAFYTGHFGWVQEGAMDMGEMGQYRFVHHGGVQIGAIMPLMPQQPVSAWTYYIGVDDIDRAVAAAKAGGAATYSEPMEIPGGEYAYVGADPQGAVFGLVGPRR